MTLIYFIALIGLFLSSNISGNGEETTTQEDPENADVTEKEGRYAYFKGNRIPDDQKYETPDEMYRTALKHILQLFMSEKGHISEVKFQHNKLKNPLDEKINKTLDEVNDLMGECADDILDILRDNISSSERVDPIRPEKFDQIAKIFKDVRRHFEERIPSSEAATEEMNIIRNEVRLAEEQLHEGYGIVKEMIKNTTLPWS